MQHLNSIDRNGSLDHVAVRLADTVGRRWQARAAQRPVHRYGAFPREALKYYGGRDLGDPQSWSVPWWSGGPRYYSDIAGQGPVSDDQARRLIYGYYAWVSYIDAQVGRVLDELDRLVEQPRATAVATCDGIG